MSDIAARKINSLNLSTKSWLVWFVLLLKSLEKIGWEVK